MHLSPFESYSTFSNTIENALLKFKGRDSPSRKTVFDKTPQEATHFVDLRITRYKVADSTKPFDLSARPREKI
jgi:hypothetical protein